MNNNVILSGLNFVFNQFFLQSYEPPNKTSTQLIGLLETGHSGFFL